MTSESDGSSGSAIRDHGETYELAARVVVLAATNLAASCVALYVFAQHPYRKKQYGTMATLWVVYVCMLAQTGTLVAACSSGWGGSILALSQRSILAGTKRYFASNLLLIPTHGFSRISVCASLWQANKQTKYSKYTLALLWTVPLWIVGSMLGIMLNRALSGTHFWADPGQDLSFKLWLCIILTGLLLDLITASIGISLIAGLQMTFAKKAYAISVFAVGVLANVPLVYSIVYLRRHHPQITANPTLFSAAFIYANQAAIAVSLWCRALEAARHLQKDVGHATWGHTTASATGTRYGAQGDYTPSSFRRQRSTIRGKPPREEDEIELHPSSSRTKYTASIKAADTDVGQPWHQDIEVTRQVWVR